MDHFCNRLIADLINEVLQKKLQHHEKFKYNLKAIVNNLHDKYIISGCDKNAERNAIICKKFYLSNLRQELDSEVYEEVNTDSEEEVRQKLKGLSEGLRKSSGAYWNYIYGIPKLHRLEP